MTPKARPFAYPTVSPAFAVQSAARSTAMAAASPSEAADIQQRWNQWVARGQRESAAFREKTRAIVVIAGAAAIFVITVLWVFSGA